MARKQIAGFGCRSLLVVLVVLCCCVAGCGCPSVALEVAPRAGALAPDFNLSTLEGQKVSLGEMRGKPVVLCFWTTVCGYCRIQMPYLQEAFDQKGGEVAFIAIDLGEDEQTVARFARDNGINFTIALDQDRAVGDAYNVNYRPTTFLVDREGVIRYIKPGPFGSADELLALLESL